MRCGRSRTTRRGSSGSAASSRPRPSRPSSTSIRSSTRLRRPCRRGPSRSSSACSSATRRSTCLADAWRLAAPRVPGARLRIVGRGTMTDIVERLVAECPDSVEWIPRLPTRRGRECDGRGDRARASVALRGARARDRDRGLLPRTRSRRQPRRRDPRPGRGRRQRAPRAARRSCRARRRARRALSATAGSPPRLGQAARAAVEPWLATPEEYAARIRELVDQVAAT